MSEYALETRLLGKEDINFDSNGTGEQTQYTDLNGDTHAVTKLNASHIPLTQAARATVDGAENVDSAIQNLHAAIQDAAGANAVGMSADKTINLETASTRQTQISAPLRNLGGHTLTFKFPEEGDVQVATAPLEFQGFYNGILIIDLNGCDIHDNGTFSPEGILRIKNCHCIVRIIGDGRNTSGYGKVIFTSNHYGIAIIHSPSCSIEHIGFESSSTASDYALYTESGNAFFTSCTFTGCKHQLMKSIYKDYVDEHMNDSSAHASLFGSKADLVHTHSMTEINGLVDSLGGKAALVHSHRVEDIEGFSSDAFDSAHYADSAGYADSTGYVASAGALVFSGGVKTAEEILASASSSTVNSASSATYLGGATKQQILNSASSSTINSATYASYLGGATKQQLIESAVLSADGKLNTSWGGLDANDSENHNLEVGTNWVASGNGLLRISLKDITVSQGCFQVIIDGATMGLYQITPDCPGNTWFINLDSGTVFRIPYNPGGSLSVMFDKGAYEYIPQ